MFIALAAFDISDDDFGTLTVSSTLKIKQAASLAAVIALILTSDGSQTAAAKLSVISSCKISTPYQIFSFKEKTNQMIHIINNCFLFVSLLPLACFSRSLFKISVASKPAFSHNCLGITSNALA